MPREQAAIVRSVFDEGVREINDLELRIVEAEDDTDAKLWKQAKKVTEQLEAGMSMRELAAQWINLRTGKPYDHTHVFFVQKAFSQLNKVKPRPRFRDAYNEIAHDGRQSDRRQERVDKINEISRGNTELDTAITYPVIYADPPWRYEHAKTENRAIENQYPTMTLDDICALKVPELATPDAVLFLWATSPKLAEAMMVLEAWGFTYRTSMVWVKDQIGMGYYARQRHELLLIATRGEPPVPEPAGRPDSVVEAPRAEHSEKPATFYDVIERMYPEFSKIELFCRSARDGWAVWGNQAT